MVSYSSLLQLGLEYRDRLLDYIYGYFPTEQGTLGLRLRGDVEDLILFVAVRFNAFNKWMTGAAALSLSSFLIVVFLSIVIAIIEIFAGVLPFPSIVLQVIPAVFALIFLGIALVAAVFSNILLVFYLAALVRYSIQKGRLGFVPKGSISSEKYRVYVDLPESNFKITRVYRTNTISFARAILYFIFIIGVIFIYLISPLLFGVLIVLINLIPISPIEDIRIMESEEMLRAIDAVVPFGLQALIETIDVEILLIVFEFLLLFGIFMNVKRIAQTRSQAALTDSELSDFEFMEEWSNFWLAIKVTIYQLRNGELNDVYQVIRGEIVTAIFGVLISLGMGYIMLIFIFELI